MAAPLDESAPEIRRIVEAQGYCCLSDTAIGLTKVRQGMLQPDAIQKPLKGSALGFQPSAVGPGAEIQHGSHLFQLGVVPLEFF